MDKIIIENLEIIAEHGVFKEEKFLGQKFIVSLEMKTDTREAGKTGNLNASTHYGFVSDDVEKLLTSQSFDLIETCAEKTAEMILTKYPLISEVKVVIKKPWAPIRKYFDFVAVEITRKWHTAYLSLGTNMGDKKKNLLEAAEKIGNLENTKITAQSTIIETEPFGYTEQDMFLNSCLEIKTLFTPRELLKELLGIELQMGRVREIKWGPRIIDIDILFFDDEIIGEADLAVPHPWICERMFVLEPLSEIAPNFVHPLEKKTVGTLKRILEKELKKQN